MHDEERKEALKFFMDAEEHEENLLTFEIENVLDVLNIFHAGIHLKEKEDWDILKNIKS